MNFICRCFSLFRILILDLVLFAHFVVTIACWHELACPLELPGQFLHLRRGCILGGWHKMIRIFSINFALALGT